MHIRAPLRNISEYVITMKAETHESRDTEIIHFRLDNGNTQEKGCVEDGTIIPIKILGDERGVEIHTSAFNVDVVQAENGNLQAIIRFNVKRPDHDHDNQPTIIFEAPVDGVIQYDNMGFVDAQPNKLGKLTIKRDDGHLGMDLYVSDGGNNIVKTAGVPWE